MSGYKQNPVSQAVWPWVEQGQSVGDKDTRPSVVASLLTLAVAWTIAAIFYYLGHLKITMAILVISGMVCFCSLFAPSAYSVINPVFQFLKRWVGLILNWILLAPFFYICFPVGCFIQKIKGKDPLSRKCPTSKESYWVSRSPVSDLEQYRRQF